MKPRVKICGLTRLEDVLVAVEAGADAIGLVFYPPSPRYVDLDKAAELARAVPPFVTIVGLFVNANPALVRETLAVVPIHLLQFHGDEDEAYCRQFDRPYMKAARVRPGMDLVQYAAAFPSAQAILLDAFVDGFGGGGKVFDWSLIPPAPQHNWVSRQRSTASTSSRSTNTRTRWSPACIRDCKDSSPPTRSPR